MDKKPKKKQSILRNNGFQTILASLLCIIIGLLIGYIVLLIINMVGASAMAGTLGGGGLGDVAIRKGYQGYDINYLIVTSAVLIILVQLVQAVGNMIYKKKS